jgi:hypothetical protein
MRIMAHLCEPLDILLSLTTFYAYFILITFLGSFWCNLVCFSKNSYYQLHLKPFLTIAKRSKNQKILYENPKSKSKMGLFPSN